MPYLSSTKFELLSYENMVRVLWPIETPEVTIPTGFKSNGASSPLLIHGLVPQYDRYLPAYVIHDWCYSKESKFSREYSDTLLRQNLIKMGMSHVKAESIYLALREFGKEHYKGGFNND